MTDLTEYGELNTDWSGIGACSPWKSDDAEQPNRQKINECRICYRPIYPGNVTCSECEPEWKKRKALWRAMAKAQVARLCELARGRRIAGDAPLLVDVEVVR